MHLPTSHPAESPQRPPQPPGPRTPPCTTVVPLPLLDRGLLPLRLPFGVFDRNVFALIGLEDRSNVGRRKDADRYRSKADGTSVSWTVRSEATFNAIDSHSRNGIMSTNPLSPGVPSHLGMMMAFSG